MFICSECGKYKSSNEEACCEGGNFVSAEELKLDEKDLRYTKVSVRKNLAELYLDSGKTLEVVKPCPKCPVYVKRIKKLKKKIKKLKK